MGAPRNKIELIGIAPIGTAIAINGQRFDCVAATEHGLRDGRQVPAMIWQSECLTCGIGFKTVSLEGQLPGTRRCDEHKIGGANRTHHPARGWARVANPKTGD